jgi:hypothetical protein
MHKVQKILRGNIMFSVNGMRMVATENLNYKYKQIMECDTARLKREE